MNMNCQECCLKRNWKHCLEENCNDAVDDDEIVGMEILFPQRNKKRIADEIASTSKRKRKAVYKITQDSRHHPESYVKYS